MALLSMLVAGDDAGSKLRVMELVGKLGFEAADAGRLKNARLLEPFAMLWIDQAMKRGRGRDFAFALVSEAADCRVSGRDHAFGSEPMDRRFCTTIARTRLD